MLLYTINKKLNNMRVDHSRYIWIFIFVSLFLFKFSPGFAAEHPSISDDKSPLNDSRNNWGLSFNYTEKGFGISSTYFIPVWKDTDLFFNLLISGVSDDRELELFDPLTGTSSIQGKENRVFMIPLSIGLQKYMFKDDIEGNFKPLVSAGITPTLVLTNPADISFFKALGHFETGFAFGGFVGIGMEYVQTKNISVNFHARYFYLPVIGKEINSLENTPINNVGGLQFVFGVNFLR
jgi:outer membrane protein W